MPLETKEEILNYAIRMRERGDSYREILSFLKNKVEDENVMDGIIHTVKTLENDGKLDIEDDGKSSDAGAIFKMIGGGSLIIFGILLTRFLWEMGWVAGLSFAVIALGFKIFFEGLAKR